MKFYKCKYINSLALVIILIRLQDYIREKLTLSLQDECQICTLLLKELLLQEDNFARVNFILNIYLYVFIYYYFYPLTLFFNR